MIVTNELSSILPYFVFEVKITITDIRAMPSCTDDLENPGQFQVQDDLTDVYFIEGFHNFYTLCFRGRK